MDVIHTRYTDFRARLKFYLDSVLIDDQVVVFYKAKGKVVKDATKNKRVVLISFAEFEALRKAAGQEGKGLLTSKAAIAAATAALPPPDITYIKPRNR